MPSGPYARMPRFRVTDIATSEGRRLTRSQAPDSDLSPPGAVMRGVVAGVSILLPLAFCPFVADPFQLPKQILFRFAALLILGVWLWRTFASGRVELRGGGIAAPFLLLVFIALLSIFQATNRPEASLVVRDLVLCGVLLFLVPPCLQPGTRTVAAGLGLGATATAFLGTGQILFGPRLTWLPSTQGGALAGDVSAGAISVCLVLPLLAALATSAPGRSRWFWAAASGGALSYVILARTRAAWLGAVVGLSWLAVSALRRRTPAGPRSGAASPPLSKLLITAALVALILLLAGTYGAGVNLLSAAPSLKFVELQGLELRLTSWRTTVEMILSRPLGFGAGNWRYAFPSAAGLLEPRTPFTISRMPLQAGSEYLETAAELGLAGLLLLLWLLSRILRQSRRNSGAGEGGLAPAAAAGIGALAACGLLASALREQPALWISLVLACLVISASASASPREGVVGWEIRPERRKLVAALVALAFVGLAGISSWSASRTLSSSAALREGQADCLRKDFGRALPALYRAGRLNPASFPARHFAGICSLQAGRPDRAEKELRGALALNPLEAQTLLALASSLRAQGRLIDAVAACEKARRVWPRDETVLLALGLVKEEAGDLRGAGAAYEAAIRQNPGSVPAHLALGGTLEKQNQIHTAVTVYSRAVTLDPYRPDCLFRLGTGLMKQGAYEAAEQAFVRLLTFVPDDVPTLVSLGRAYAGLQRHCQAVDPLKRARDLETNAVRAAMIDQSLQDARTKCQKTGEPRR